VSELFDPSPKGPVEVICDDELMPGLCGDEDPPARPTATPAPPGLVYDPLGRSWPAFSQRGSSPGAGSSSPGAGSSSFGSGSSSPGAGSSSAHAGCAPRVVVSPPPPAIREVVRSGKGKGKAYASCDCAAAPTKEPSSSADTIEEVD